MRLSTCAILFTSVLAFAACEEGGKDTASAKPDKATETAKPAPSGPTKAAKAGGSAAADLPKVDSERKADKAVVEAPKAPVTSPSQQTYSMDAIKKIPDNCSKPFVIMSTAPNKVGQDYAWTWSRQAMLANQQFKVVDGEPQVPGQVSFQLHLAAPKFNKAWVLVAKCKDGGTCNRLAAMYKAIVKGAAASPVCGKLPMDLSPVTFKKPVLREAGFSTNTLPGAKDGVGLCARLHACTIAMDPSKASTVNIGLQCQKAPSKFKVQCARKYPCAEVMKCLGN